MVVLLHHEVQYELESVFAFGIGDALQVLVDLVPPATEPQFLVGFLAGAIYADSQLVEVLHHVGNPRVELLEHQSVGQYGILDVVTLRGLFHEVPVHVRCERVTVGSDVHLYGSIVVVQPFVYPVRQSDAQSVCGALLVEYQLLAATGTPEVATVVYGQSQVPDAPGGLLEYVLLDVGALPVVAVAIGAVRYGTLQVAVHVRTHYLRQALDL